MSTAHEVRDAVAALVEGVTDLTEYVATPDASGAPAVGWFSVRPVALSGLGKSRRGWGDQRLDLLVDIRVAAVPDPAARVGDALDLTQRMETALLADVDGTVAARLSLGDVVYDYTDPGYIGITFTLSVDGLLTAPS